MFLKEVFIPFPNIQMQKKEKKNKSKQYKRDIYLKKYSFPFFFPIKANIYGELRRRQWQPISVLLPGKAHGRRGLVGCSPWGRKESDTTERIHFHFSPSCIGEGNGNLLQCSCLENPRDRQAWWAAVYGVAQSRTRLK